MFAASIHKMALMALNWFYRIVKLANYRRYIYYCLHASHCHIFWRGTEWFRHYPIKNSAGIHDL